MYIIVKEELIPNLPNIANVTWIGVRSTPPSEKGKKKEKGLKS